MCNLMNTHTHAHTIPPWDQCEGQIMTRVTGLDCAVVNNLVDTQTHTRASTRTHAHVTVKDLM